MNVTPYGDVNDLLDELRAQLRIVLGERVVGLYLFGSLVTGDFDREISDLDLLAVITAEPGERELAELRQLHAGLEQRNPRWKDRVEVGYLTTAAVAAFEPERSPIAIISPGEPFHTKQAGADWLVNLHTVRERGIVLDGPPAATLIRPITHAEFVGAVETLTREWPPWVRQIERRRPSLAYAVVTLCRALFTHTHGEQCSKREAARWAMGQLPEWAPLIERALRWREHWRDEQVEDDAAYEEAVRFVEAVARRVTG